MKHINAFVLERLKLNSDSKVRKHKYAPNTLNELDEIIRIKLKDMTNIFDPWSKKYDLDLTDVDVSNLDSLEGAIGSHAAIKSVNISGWNISHIEDISGMFEECSYLQKIIGLDTLDTSSVKLMTDLFEGCKNLEEIDLSKWNFNNVTDMAHMFSNCSGLKTIKGLENLNFTSLNRPAKLRSMFRRCTSLEKLDISKWKFNKLPICKNMFSLCEKLTDVGNIDHWKTYINNGTIERIRNMFDGAESLKKYPDWYK